MQHDIVGVNHRHIEAKKLIHGVMRDRGGGTKAKKGDF
ncbi:hypothetical protein LTSESEN_1976, partial [Salmonella enterica subsp. enterica serovar Senftenberg str. A4-543]